MSIYTTFTWLLVTKLGKNICVLFNNNQIKIYQENKEKIEKNTNKSVLWKVKYFFVIARAINLTISVVS